MKKSKFTESQIIGILKEQEQGAKVSELCRQHGISDATFYNWKSKYGGMNVDELRRLRDLEQENARLKKIVANQSLDIDIMKDVISKKW
ncbi:MAG TPA: transposase [Allocoleopsis sp.]